MQRRANEHQDTDHDHHEDPSSRLDGRRRRRGRRRRVRGLQDRHGKQSRWFAFSGTPSTAPSLPNAYRNRAPPLPPGANLHATRRRPQDVHKHGEYTRSSALRTARVRRTPRLPWTCPARSTAPLTRYTAPPPPPPPFPRAPSPANIAYDAKALKACFSDPTGPDGTVYTTWEECSMVSGWGRGPRWGGVGWGVPRPRACRRAGAH